MDDLKKGATVGRFRRVGGYMKRFRVFAVQRRPPSPILLPAPAGADTHHAVPRLTSLLQPAYAYMGSIDSPENLTRLREVAPVRDSLLREVQLWSLQPEFRETLMCILDSDLPCPLLEADTCLSVYYWQTDRERAPTNVSQP